MKLQPQNYHDIEIENGHIGSFSNMLLSTGPTADIIGAGHI